MVTDFSYWLERKKKFDLIKVELVKIALQKLNLVIQFKGSEEIYLTALNFWDYLSKN